MYKQINHGKQDYTDLNHLIRSYSEDQLTQKCYIIMLSGNVSALTVYKIYKNNPTANGEEANLGGDFRITIN